MNNVVTDITAIKTDKRSPIRKRSQRKKSNAKTDNIILERLDNAKDKKPKRSKVRHSLLTAPKKSILKKDLSRPISNKKVSFNKRLEKIKHIPIVKKTKEEIERDEREQAEREKRVDEEDRLEKERKKMEEYQRRVEQQKVSSAMSIDDYMNQIIN